MTVTITEMETREAIYL